MWLRILFQLQVWKKTKIKNSNFSPLIFPNLPNWQDCLNWQATAMHFNLICNFHKELWLIFNSLVDVCNKTWNYMHLIYSVDQWCIATSTINQSHSSFILYLNLSKLETALQCIQFMFYDVAAEKHCISISFASL